ncbi:X-Pro aminopeptidase [Ceratobasidium theobromae]|uniref:X-Pro aminopeptidase n=1 Tax=Ceratobasidium theobromae TaxID=1582974 RepID=A0A5N5QIM0_9AGAM|nr:X-Pro aminopeptidase [Ceratobasidium theobromae]
MAPPPPPQIPAALANLCQLPGVKRSNTTSTFRSKSSLDSRPTFTTQSSYNTTLDKVSFDSATDDSMSYTAPAQTAQWGWARATNVDGVIKLTTLDGAEISAEKLVRKPSTDTGYRKTDTSSRLSELRKLMRAEKIDYYIVPSEDAHQSEYVAASDRRREYISGFTGSAGTAIVSLNNAYLFTDSRYYIQAEREVDRNWTLHKVGMPNVKPWNEWILNRARGAAIGIDSRLIAHDTATALTASLKLKGMRMVYPQRNLVDQIWKDRPSKSAAPIYTHDLKFAGEHAAAKLERLRKWLREYPVPAADLKYSSTAPRSASPALGKSERPTSKPLPDLPPPSRTPSRQNSIRKNSISTPSRQNSTSAPARTPSRQGVSRHNSTASRDNTHRDRGETAVRLIPHYSTFVSSLGAIAWLLNLRGGDVPHNPLFHAYLWVGVDKATLFVDARKLSDDIKRYLRELRVSVKEVAEVWGYLRKREFGSGKVILPPKTPYAVSLMLTHANYMIAPSWIDAAKAIKNKTEMEGFRRAYLRDGIAMTKWFAWLEEQLRSGNTITEWEASEMLTQFRKQGDYFMGLAYENISATGANAALPHYTPTKGLSSAIDIHTPYLNDSGGQYKDGTCDTTRTVHFGHPSDEQCEAYTRVLKGHIAIDSAIFPQGTTGKQLDVLARQALWKDGLNYLHGTGHGFGSFLSVHEGPHGFGIDVPLEPGHVITNEPGFYKEGSFGIRIESALGVKRVETKGQFGGDIWLGFERFTCVPIQTRMVKMEMLTKEERRWLKEHNRKCRDMLAPYLEEDRRALRWIRRESTRTSPTQTPAGVTVDWD